MKYVLNKPGVTMQKSEVNKRTFRSWILDRISDHLGISFLTSLNHQLFKNTAYVGYFWHFVISGICVFVNLYLCICVFDSWEYQL